ncbi:hypothetical protein [Streptomyces sp. NPDC058632]|uniref:hypothetical protein n=1 Tax=Streptomyces sp. NPDC058632 TaxID=3346567 RepID=UPI0036582C55
MAGRRSGTRGRRTFRDPWAPRVTRVRRDGPEHGRPRSTDAGYTAAWPPGHCPVCWSGGAGRRCGACGWEPGEATAAGGPAARDAEIAACWSWDMSAAVLATRHLAAEGRSRGVTPGGTVDLRLSPLIRRAPATAVHGPRPFDAPDPFDPSGFPGPIGTGERRDVAGSPAGAVSLLTALAAGEYDAVCVLGISATGLALRELGRCPQGTGWTHNSPGGDLRWPDLAPWLPASTAERAFLLAGGIGVTPPYGTRGVPRAADQAWEPAVRRALAAMLAPLDAARSQGRAVPLVLVGQAHGWRWPSYAARALTARTPAAARMLLDAADPRALDDIVQGVCRQVPLRHGYALLTRPAPGGSPDQRADAGARILFPGGTTLPEEGELFASVELLADADGAGDGDASTRAGPKAPPAADADRAQDDVFALPLVTARGARTEDWPVLHTGRTRVRPGRRTTVTVALDSHGGLRFTEPESSTDSRTGRTLPHSTAADSDADADRGAGAGADAPRATAADVLLLLELGGSQAESERRVRFLRSVLRHLGAAVPPGPGAGRPGGEIPKAPTGLRIGLVGYEDHKVLPVRAGPEGDCVLSVWGPGSAEAAAEAVRRFPVRPVRHDYGAPLEDALHAAAHWRHWRDGARHLLLVLARRPPHPARQQSDLSLPCPERYDYEEALRRLRTVVCPDLTVIGVRDAAAVDTSGGWRPQTRERLRHIWRDLGRDHLFTLGTHTPEDIASCVDHALGRPAGAPGLLTDPATAPAALGTARRPGARIDSSAVPPSQKDSEHHE